MISTVVTAYSNTVTNTKIKPTKQIRVKNYVIMDY